MNSLTAGIGDMPSRNGGTMAILSKIRLGLVVVGLSLPSHVPTLLAAPPIDELNSIVDLIERDAPLDSSQVPIVRLGSTTTESRFFPDRTMRHIALKMTSQKYRGVDCRHDVDIYLPDRPLPDESQRVAAIILGGNEIRAAELEMDWLESVVLQMGIPCVVIQQAFVARQFGAKNAGELMSFGNQRYMETGDPREAGYYALAKIFSAAATVAEDLPELRARRFIVTGSSKGGMAALIACAGDSRIVGAYPTAWNAGAVLGFTRLKGQRWGWDIKPKETGPAGQSARESLAVMDTPRGTRYRELFDPAEWDELLAGKFVMPAVGTNDPLFHLLSDDNYFDEWQCRKALLRIPNYGHGRRHVQHTLGWRAAVAAALQKRQIPSIQLVSETSGDEVELVAKIRGDYTTLELELWQTTDSTGDYRKAKWVRIDAKTIKRGSNRVPLMDVSVPSAGTAAYYVRLNERSQDLVLVNSSNIVELGMPINLRQ